MRHANGISKRFGFVCFSTPEEAKKALHTFNGSVLEGRSLYVAFALNKEDCKMDQSDLNHTVFRPTSPVYNSFIPDSSFYSLPNSPLMNVGLEFPFVQNYQHHLSTSGQLMRQIRQNNTGNQSFQQNAGDPFIALYTGTRQSRIAFSDLGTEELPSYDNLSKILASFASRGINARETVSLFDFGESKLQKHFGARGKLISVRVMCHANGISRRFGFVCFSTLEEAKKVLRTFSEGTSLYVAFDQRKEDCNMNQRDKYSFTPYFSFYSLPNSPLIDVGMECPLVQNYQHHLSTIVQK
ncbi:polyadenylate-binding protein, cytoplasmic and nuclear isoform X2 [Ziziphus jujuba]|uniref:Polyadenylate-binding protein, cytoplasmic and nuclear isoform X2 n=1 Tax=Ziziphus jujuba TaxID=326968 RepID=A0ABM4A359_ZIZJJ|nr:polyadenylate-binding protein, cytoplasmic and nuclear isoform X2 [Ziziphus jujuba]